MDVSNVVFITGVSSGIGRHALQTLVEKKYHVIGSVRKEEDAKKLKDNFGDNISILRFDVTDIDRCKIEIEKVKPLLEKKGLHCLINNAGVAMPGPLQYLSEEDFETQLDINVNSVRRITNLLLPFLGTNPKFTPGLIINISSVSGLFNSPFNGAYCISKHALESMTDIYRRELSSFGIKVVAIEPGPIRTEIWSKNLGQMDKYKDTEYGHLVAFADKMIQNSEKSGLDVSVISNLIVKIMGAKNPETRYLVHKDKLKFKILSRFLPDKWADKLVKKALSGGENYRPV